jgi:hypothetical protein
LYVLQPLCVLKEYPTSLEKTIIESYGDKRFYTALEGAYEQFRIKLSEIADNNVAYFCDCSNALSQEKNTLFCDLWHFSDFGHSLFADCIQEKLIRVLTDEEKI